MISHKWRPLDGPDVASSDIDFREIDSLHQQWMNFREQREEFNPEAYKSFLERVERRWAIETGIIEGIYSIDRGMTQTLIENGLIADLIDRDSTNRDPQELVRILKDHQDTAKFVTETIRNQRPLSKQYIVELHQILTLNQPTYTAVNQFGREFEATLDRGGFKKWPNNPTRPDGLIHEYCPPLQVESEIDNLINWYNELQQAGSGYHQLLVAVWLHHRFTQIHPFQDGNGRVARALLTWHLVKERYLPIVISRDERSQYIETLESADAGNLSPFVALIVQLERRTILEALGEPEPVAESGMVDQVMDHIIEQIRRQNHLRQAQMRSVNDVAHALRNNAISNLLSQADQICQRFNEAGMVVGRVIDHGGPGDREHWYKTEVIQTAQEAQHWANLNESRFFVKLSINPEEQSRTPRLVFVISLHHVGQQLTGIMAATAFAQIRDSRELDWEESQEPADLYFRNCTIDPFTFTWQDDPATLETRFVAWIEERLSIALRYWSEFIS